MGKINKSLIKFFISPIILFILFIFLFNQKILAEEIAGSSAGIILNSNNIFIIDKKINYDIYKIRKTIFNIFKKNNSPLLKEIDSFIKICFTYELNCYLLPAIAGLESSYGKYIYPNSHNPFGWGGGYIKFNSWQESIETVAFKLKKNYIDKGLVNIEDIGSVYSESPTWSIRIKNLISQFEKEEKSNLLLFPQFIVKL